MRPQKYIPLTGATLPPQVYFATLVKMIYAISAKEELESSCYFCVVYTKAYYFILPIEWQNSSWGGKVALVY